MGMLAKLIYIQRTHKILIATLQISDNATNAVEVGFFLIRGSKISKFKWYKPIQKILAPANVLTAISANNTLF